MCTPMHIHVDAQQDVNRTCGSPCVGLGWEQLLYGSRKQCLTSLSLSLAPCTLYAFVCSFRPATVSIDTDGWCQRGQHPVPLHPEGHQTSLRLGATQHVPGQISAGQGCLHTRTCDTGTPGFPSCSNVPVSPHSLCMLLPA
jgi:hypothetical protein